MRMLLVLTLIFPLLTRCDFDDWHEDYYPEQQEIDVIRPERKDNMYVKGSYGYQYSTQRFSHLDYIVKEYDSSDKELGEHLQEYRDTYEININ